MPITCTPYSAVYFNPQAISGCCVWLDAADPVSFNSGAITNGTTITQWNDKSGVGQSITVAGTPVWNSTTLNSSPSVNLTNGRFSGVFTNTLSNFTSTAFIITSLNSYPTGGYPCLAFQNTPSGSFLRVLDYAGGFRFITFIPSVASVSTTASLSTPFLWATTYNGTTNMNLYYNGSNTANSTTASSPGSNAGYFYLGTEAGDIPGSNSWPGYVSEVVVYTSVLTQTQRQQVEGYLAQKWGLTSQLPAGHPGLTQTIYTSNYNYKFYLLPNNLALQTTYYKNFNLLTTIPNCAIWLDAADTTTITTTGGTTLATWVNKGSIGSSATPGTGTTTTNVATYNSNNIIQFAASTKLNITLAIPNQPRAWFAVFRQTYQLNVSNPYFQIFGAFVSGYDQIAGPEYNSSTGNYNMDEFRDGIAGMVDTISATNGYNVFKIYNWTNSAVSTANNRIAINGTPLTLTGSSLASGYSTGSITYSIMNGYLPSADIAELILINGEITNVQTQLIESYLAQKWGLQDSLPRNHLNFTNPAGLPAVDPSLVKNITTTLYFLENFSNSGITSGSPIGTNYGGGTLVYNNWTWIGGWAGGIAVYGSAVTTASPAPYPPCYTFIETYGGGPFTPALLYKTISLPAGGPRTISFYTSIRSGTATIAPASLTVSYAGNTIGTVTSFPSTWTLQTFTFTYTALTGVLQFSIPAVSGSTDTMVMIQYILIT